MLQKLTVFLLFAFAQSKLTVDIYQELIPKEIAGSKTNLEWDFLLSCSVTSDSEQNVTVKWFKDDEEIELKGRFAFSEEANVYNLTVKKIQEEDRGIYECVAKAADQTTSTSSSGLFGLSVPKKTKVTDGDELKIQCVVLGGPPVITWKINDNDVQKDDERVSLIPDVNGTENAILLINASNQNDTGFYTCIGNVEGKIIEKTCEVVVIDPLAALFPFLCICAEVAILCALIFLYEKKFQKKNPVANHK